MKKLFRRITSLLFAAVLTFGTFAACKDDEPTSSGGQTQTETTQTTESETHYAKITERNDYIVKDGKALYTIVIPAEAKSYEKQAAELLNEYYQKALGVTLKVVTDEQASATGKYVSLGATKQLKESGIAIPYSKYGDSGFRIITKGDDVYIAGAHSNLRAGTYYGVQEFLYHTVGYRAYTLTEVRYEQKSDVKMADFDVVEIPDFNVRNVGYITTSQSATNRKEPDHNDILRLTAKPGEKVEGLSGHSHFQILPPATYYDEHKDWYYWTNCGDYTAENHEAFYYDAQLCLTNEEMTEEFIRVVTQMFFDQPEASFIHIGQMDSDRFCRCENCDNWRIEHDTNDAGITVAFTNKVARAVTKNVQERYPERQLTFEMFAYYTTIEPPVHLVDGKYVADCEEVIPDENVMVQYTPIEANGTQTVDHQLNAEHYQYLLGWKALNANISTWCYCIDFDTFQISTKQWDVIAEDLRLYKDFGVTNMYYQGPLFQEVFQMWEMRLWIISKLMWNTSLQWQTLSEEFIREFYGPTATTVQEYYDYMTTYYEKLRTLDNLTGVLFGGTVLDDKKMWPYSYVEGARSIFVKGYEDLQALKTSDPANYEKYYWRMTGVYFENMYMQLDFYMSNYSVEHRVETFELFKAAMDKFDVDTYDQSRKWTTYLNKWEANLYVE